MPPCLHFPVSLAGAALPSPWTRLQRAWTSTSWHMWKRTSKDNEGVVMLRSLPLHRPYARPPTPPRSPRSCTTASCSSCRCAVGVPSSATRTTGAWPASWRCRWGVGCGWGAAGGACGGGGLGLGLGEQTCCCCRMCQMLCGNRYAALRALANLCYRPRTQSALLRTCHLPHTPCGARLADGTQS